MKVVVFLLLVVMIAVIWLMPFAASALGIDFLLFSLAIAIYFIFEKHREAYRQGNITRAIFVRNILFEIFGILLAMTLAGLLGGYIAQIATDQITNDLTKLIAGVVIGLLAGIGVGFIVSRIWGKLSTKLNSIHQ